MIMIDEISVLLGIIKPLIKRRNSRALPCKARQIVVGYSDHAARCKCLGKNTIICSKSVCLLR